jgi:hypothetical protein
MHFRNSGAFEQVRGNRRWLYRFQGVMEYWSTGVMVYRSELYASENLDSLGKKLQKIGDGFSFFQFWYKNFLTKSKRR